MPNPQALDASAGKLKPRQRILVMRYRFIGDTLLSVPFLRNLRAAYPDATIDFLAAPNSGELLQDCPYIDELIFFDTTRKHRYENPAIEQQSKKPSVKRLSFWHYVQRLRSRRYDTVFVLKRSFSSAALAFLAGIPERIGFNTEGRGWLLTRQFPYRQDAHEVDCFLDGLTAAGIPVTQGRYLESWGNAQAHQKAAGILETHLETGMIAAPALSRQVVLHLTSSNPAKQWPESHALQLVLWLLTENACQIHCLGAASDESLYARLRNRLPLPLQSRMHIHCGQLSLNESMAFLKRMNLMVGVDSGTLHMAAAAGIPVIALFGPMDESKWGPLGASIVNEPVSCRPCNLEKTCAFNFQCMQNLRPEAVIETITKHAGFI